MAVDIKATRFCCLICWNWVVWNEVDVSSQTSSSSVQLGKTVTKYRGKPVYLSHGKMNVSWYRASRQFALAWASPNALS